ncbi:MAG: hypothetical protein Q4G26_15210 [Paracoccus sp. (in: a-proteobacteria)]|nr:hypothetical protein [Paracoccus sp. (in: a-proteobacteria)]
MTALSQDEIRALDKDERDLVEQTLAAGLAGMEGAALSDLIRRLRERRDRARDLADRQRREARGKAAPAGIQPAAGDAGMRLKAEVLTAALSRATAARGDNAPEDETGQQQQQQQQQQGRPEHIEDDSLHPRDHAGHDQSMLDQTRRQAPSGALDHAGEAPSRERASKRP